MLKRNNSIYKFFQTIYIYNILININNDIFKKI